MSIFMFKFKYLVFVLLAVVLLGVGCSKNAKDGSSTGVAEVIVTMPAGGAPLPEAVVEYRNQEFDPPTLRIIAGTKVTFVNKDKNVILPKLEADASQEICSGFGATSALKKGENYSYTFNRVGECRYFNQLKPSQKGAIDARSAQ